MRPVLKPGLRRVWRDESTLQIGLDPERAVVLSGVDAPIVSVLASLDGTRDRAGVLASALRAGLDDTTVERLLGILDDRCLLDDAARDTTALAELERGDRERLAPDLISLSLLERSSGGGLASLQRRRRAEVHVHGAGRVGTPLAGMLAAAGVGCIHVEDGSPTRHSDVTPAGACADDVGVPRDTIARRVLRRASSSVSTEASGRSPDLVVLAPDGTPEPGRRDALTRQGQPHLYAGVRETTGIVGPLVVPGESSCLRCHDLHRSDRDPAWPQVAAQIATGTGRYACDTVLASLVATVATAQVLAFLDGRPVASTDGTLEISLTDGRTRRRSWSPHPACGCRWAQDADALQPAASAT